MTPIVVSAVDLSSLEHLIARIGDDWKLSNEVQKLAAGRPGGFLGALLWRGFQAGLPVATHGNYLSHLMHGAPEFWTAKDLIALIQGLEKAFPDAVLTGGASGWWSSDGIPGDLYAFTSLLEEKAGDADFARTMRAEWGRLPEPWRLAVGYRLAACGHMPYTDLSAPDLERLARIQARFGQNSPFSSRNPVPAQVWWPLVAKVALADPSLEFRDSRVLADLKPFLSLPDLLRAASHCAVTWHDLATLRMLQGLGPDAVQALEALLPTLTVPAHPQDAEKPWPHELYAFGYLLLCKAQGRTPPPALDPYLGDVLRLYRRTWSGGDLEGLLAAFHEGLSAIPLERLEPMLLRDPEWNWIWAQTCPTPKMLQAITDRVIAFGAKPDWKEKRTIGELTTLTTANGDLRGLLLPLVKELVPYATTALQAKKQPPQRHIFAWVLAQSGLAAAADGLALCAADSSRAVRDCVKSAVLAQGPKVMLAPLALQMKSKKKDVRKEIARILAEFPKDAGVNALAAKHLATEKDPDVIEALKDVK